MLLPLVMMTLLLLLLLLLLLPALFVVPRRPLPAAAGTLDPTVAASASLGYDDLSMLPGTLPTCGHMPRCPRIALFFCVPISGRASTLGQFTK